MGFRTRLVLTAALAAVVVLVLGGVAGATQTPYPTPSPSPALGDPTVGKTSPHGGYSSSTNFCLSCHAVHTTSDYTDPTSGADYEYALLWKDSVTATCKTCHGVGGVAATGARTSHSYLGSKIGTASARTAYDNTAPAGEHGIGAAAIPDPLASPLTQIEYADHEWTTPTVGPGTSSASGGGLYCGSCHTPHGERGHLVNGWATPNPTASPSPIVGDEGKVIYRSSHGEYYAKYLHWETSTKVWQYCNDTASPPTGCVNAVTNDAKGQPAYLYGYKLLSSGPNHDYSAVNSYGVGYGGDDSAEWCATCHKSKVNGDGYHNHPGACTRCHGNAASDSGFSTAYPDFPHTGTVAKLLQKLPDALCRCHTSNLP
jgi:hypothetical protein